MVQLLLGVICMVYISWAVDDWANQNPRRKP